MHEVRGETVIFLLAPSHKHFLNTCQDYGLDPRTLIFLDPSEHGLRRLRGHDRGVVFTHGHIPPAAFAEVMTYCRMRRLAFVDLEDASR